MPAGNTRVKSGEQDAIEQPQGTVTAAGGASRR
jgi:hypothetical protein